MSTVGLYRMKQFLQDPGVNNRVFHLFRLHNLNQITRFVGTDRHLPRYHVAQQMC